LVACPSIYNQPYRYLHYCLKNEVNIVRYVRDDFIGYGRLLCLFCQPISNDAYNTVFYSVHTLSIFHFKQRRFYIAIDCQKMVTRSLIAVCQLSAQHDLAENFARSAQMIERAGAMSGCKVRREIECYKNE
jgi:hypothetical protein